MCYNNYINQLRKGENMKNFLSKCFGIMAMCAGAFLFCGSAGAEADKQIKVSVIVPVYNVEEYVGECLDSLCSQTLKDIEIICVNDGSTDSSLKILREYEKKDSRVKVIDKANGGQSSAKNAGIEIARGKYLAFVDSDDFIDKDAYRFSYELAELYQTDILCFGWTCFPKDAGGRQDCEPEGKIYTNWFKAKKQRESIRVWNKLYKRSLIMDNNFRFNVNIKCADDECFNLCVYPLAKKIVTIPNKFYHYRLRQGSVVFSGAKKMMVDYINVWKYVIKVWKTYEIESSQYFKLFTYPLIYKDEFISFVKSCF